MHIILVGRGGMAQAIETACIVREIGFTRFADDLDETSFNHENLVAIHFGSGRQLPHLIEFCKNRRIPIIQGSTDLNVSLPSTIGQNVAIINAPNLSLPMIRFMSAFPAFAQAIGLGMKMSVIESHQDTKVDVSGTARAIVTVLGNPESSIKSVRDPDIQLLLGVPGEHLSCHAHHKFIFIGQGVEIRVSTKISGRSTYTDGALTLAQKLTSLRAPLKNGIYGLEDISHIFSTL